MRKDLAIVSLMSVAAFATVVSAMGVVASNNKGISFINADASIYSATIDKNNRLIDVGRLGSSSYDYFAFRLHGGENYGLFSTTNKVAYSDSLPSKYSDYAFSWTRDGAENEKRYTGRFSLENVSNKYQAEIDGVYKSLRGFPKVKSISVTYVQEYNDAPTTSEHNVTFGVGPVGSQSDWTTTQTINGNKITKVSSPNNPESFEQKYWSFGITLTNGATKAKVYIESITINYTC